MFKLINVGWLVLSFDTALETILLTWMVLDGRSDHRGVPIATSDRLGHTTCCF